MLETSGVGIDFCSGWEESGGMLLQKLMNFRPSESNSGAFSDDLKPIPLQV